MQYNVLSFFFLVMDVVVVFFFSAGRVQSFDENEIRLVNTLIISCTFTSHHFFFSHNTLFINAICQLFRVIAEAASQLHFAELRKIVIVFHMHYLWMLSSHFFEAKTMNGFRYILFFMYSWAKKLQKQRALAFLILKLCGFLPHWRKNWTG